MPVCENMKNVFKPVGRDSSGAKLFVQKEGVIICGRVKEIRYLLKTYASRYRTVEELITCNLN
jgi:hypothetical protein